MKTFTPLWLILFFALLSCGCAAGGPKFIDLTYTGPGGPGGSGAVGIAGFTDERENAGEGYVGKRKLRHNREETYFVDGLDLAGSVTKAVSAYLEKSGYTVSRIEKWTHSTDGVKNAPSRFDTIIGGDVLSFECSARKNATTHMDIEISLVVYIGDVKEGKFQTIPVELTMERRELGFSARKLENLLNDSLEEVLQKALDENL